MDNQNLVTPYYDLKHALNQLIGPVQFSQEINLKLERITHLLELIGNPHKSYPTIHIGGTSGKGSTAHLISQILSCAGYKTGLYTSPHLQIINERFQINNQFVPSSRLLQLYREIESSIEQVTLENPFGQPSYFEVQVALAFRLFEQERVDVAVIEVGLGGRLDATNVVDAKVAVITNIGLDHTNILGDTIELIAKDKVEIIKPGQTVISGLTQTSTKKIIAEKCRQVEATLWQLDENYKIEHHEDNFFSIKTPGRVYENLKLSMIGEFQVQNAACAVSAIHAFDPKIPISRIREGLKRTRVPGRMELIQDNPTIILDGAHNPDKIKAASEAVERYFSNKKRVVIFALKDGKAYKDIIPYVIEDAISLIVTTFSTELWSPINPEILAAEARRLNPNLEIRIQSNPLNAVEMAISMADKGTLIWITGSLYLVGNVRYYWYPLEVLLEGC